jgi:hypothetical protein
MEGSMIFFSHLCKFIDPLTTHHVEQEEDSDFSDSLSVSAVLGSEDHQEEEEEEEEIPSKPIKRRKKQTEYVEKVKLPREKGAIDFSEPLPRLGSPLPLPSAKPRKKRRKQLGKKKEKKKKKRTGFFF